VAKLTREQRDKANSMMTVLRQRDELESNIMVWINEDPAEWVNRLNAILVKYPEERTEQDERTINSFCLFAATTIINGFREEIVEAWRDERDPMIDLEMPSS